MDSESRLDLIKSVGEEIITEDELRVLLQSNDRPKAYDGFEPSGMAHVPFGLFRAITLKKLLKADVQFTLYLADYFAFANNKLGSDLNKIRECGEYFIEVWKAAGIPVEKVQFVWASDLMDSIDYWDLVLRVGKHLTLNRVKRATTIMGRTEAETETLHAAQLMYPLMQVSDIFALDVDICQLGMDQRRANVLAREVAPALKKKIPVAVHHHMLLGLQGLSGKDITQAKMSKSRPESSIFVHDSEAEILKKINSAYCPEKIVENNPVLDYCKHLVFEEFKSMKIERPAKFGGTEEFHSYAELEKSFREGKLHPMDLKKSTAEHLNKMIAPIRAHFEKDKKAGQLLEKVRQAQVTR